MAIRTDPQMGKKAVISQANDFRRDYCNNEGSMRDALIEWVTSKNGKIEYIANSNKEETLLIQNDKSFVIYLPLGTITSRDNFTLAHEIGHYVMHTDFSVPGVATHTRRGSNHREWEANWFAAELLMPEKEFRDFANNNNNDIRLLAKRFEVSGSAARVRLEALGLIDD